LNLQFLSFKTFKTTLKRFIQKRCDVEARSLSYLSLFTIIPLFSVVLIQLSRFSFYPILKDRLITGISNYFLPDKASVIVKYIDSIMENTGSIGLIGIIFTIAMAFSLITALSKTVNNIWGKKRSHALIHNFIKFLTIILCAPILIVLTFYLQNHVLLNKYIVSIYKFFPFTLNGKLFLPAIFSLILNWILLTAIYFFIPYDKVKFVYSLLAGIVSGSIWYLTRLGLNIYLKIIPQMNLLYGSFTFIPIFLIWLYFTWIIVLFGVELNYSFHFELLKKSQTK